MVVQESVFRDIARLLVWYPIRWITKLIPISWNIYLLRELGKIHALISQGRKKHLQRQYTLIFNSEITGISVKHFINEYLTTHYLNQLSIFFFPRLNKHNIGRYHSFVGLEHLEAALKKNHGVILLHGHFGPAQLTLVALGLAGYQVIQIGFPTDKGLSWIGRKVAFRLRLKEEAKIPARIIAADKFLRPVVEGLRKNAIVMTSGDGAGGGTFIGKFISASFLGKQLPFAVGGIQLAERTGASVLPIFLIPKTAIHWETIIYPALPETGSVAERLEPFIRQLEIYVRRYPGLWRFWDELDKRMEYAQHLLKQKMK
ncbi:MAG: lysophospholipid acyltransferase family protein [bacterium]|nr:lysophospholipid acyltransferase family protein [bacterium]